MLDTVFYNSGDVEIKDQFGQFILLNTFNCNSNMFSYVANTLALRFIDQSKLSLKNLATPVNGAYTTDDYL